MMRRVCVFCGSSAGARPVYAEMAAATGRAIAARGLGLVYGGGNVGLMGIVAESAIAAGAPVTGIIPHGLMRRERVFPGGAEMHLVDTMHERKAMMADLSDGFLVLPGGVGTLEEAVEAITWTQLGIQAKGVVFLEVEGFWQGFMSVLDQMVDEGFVRPQQRTIAQVATSPEEALDRLASFKTPVTEIWLGPEET
jgi:uncharacterized protein (TIGR00730 family)